MICRTRDAIAELGVDIGGHRSRQLTDHDVATTDVVICMAAEHVAYMRRIHPEAAAKTVTLKRIVRDLPGGPGALGPRLAELHLADVELGSWEEVADPAGGDLPVFQACAREIGELIDRLAPLLGGLRSREAREEIA